jgi:hypothetical protein
MAMNQNSPPGSNEEHDSAIRDSRRGVTWNPHTGQGDCRGGSIGEDHFPEDRHHRQSDIPTEISLAIIQIRNAILNEGPSPSHHREVMETFRREWPTLYHAIMRLIQVT